ncbi:MAG: hypothetical protein H6613_18385 [Ignavibacteriales bacterium]|nr:hypothetical protein [Ignavibacteriales bacterium]
MLNQISLIVVQRFQFLRNGLAINKIGGDLDFGDIIYTGNAITLTEHPIWALSLK